MRKTILAITFLALPGAAAAQVATAPAQPDPAVREVGEDWTAFTIGQGHLFKSIQALIEERNADKAKIRDLEAEVLKLKPVDQVAKDPAKKD